MKQKKSLNLSDSGFTQINGMDKIKGGANVTGCDNTIVAKCGGCISVIPPKEEEVVSLPTNP